MQRAWRRERFRSIALTGLLAGIGLVGSLDEIVMHQLLRWHNFYVDTDLDGRLISDGLFHAATTALLALGLYRLWAGRDLLRERGSGHALFGGTLLGMGAFNLFDGIVNHHLLRIHPIREGVATWPYDVAYLALAAALLVGGLAVLRRLPA